MDTIRKGTQVRAKRDLTSLEQGGYQRVASKGQVGIVVSKIGKYSMGEVKFEGRVYPIGRDEIILMGEELPADEDLRMVNDETPAEEVAWMIEQQYG